jgi:hypothetical protein
VNTASLGSHTRRDSTTVERETTDASRKESPCWQDNCNTKSVGYYNRITDNRTTEYRTTEYRPTNTNDVIDITNCSKVIGITNSVMGGDTNSRISTSAPLQTLVQCTEPDEGQHVRKANTNDAEKAREPQASQTARGQEHQKSVHYSPHQNGWRRRDDKTPSQNITQSLTTLIHFSSKRSLRIPDTSSCLRASQEMRRSLYEKTNSGLKASGCLPTGSLTHKFSNVIIAVIAQ